MPQRRNSGAISFSHSGKDICHSVTFKEHFKQCNKTGKINDQAESRGKVYFDYAEAGVIVKHMFKNKHYK